MAVPMCVRMPSLTRHRALRGLIPYSISAFFHRLDHHGVGTGGLENTLLWESNHLDVDQIGILPAQIEYGPLVIAVGGGCTDNMTVLLEYAAMQGSVMSTWYAPASPMVARRAAAEYLCELSVKRLSPFRRRSSRRLGSGMKRTGGLGEPFDAAGGH